MTTPKPGQPVRGSETGRPIMALLDLLGRRWVLRIIWELREESLNFNELQKRCDKMSSSVLAQRLIEMRETLIVTQDEQGIYQLTGEGKILIEAFAPLNDWAKEWEQKMKL
jgi:DNA-binding HxlR family transcriptional regulator